MKKLLAIMVLLLISTGAMAQLNVIKETENTWEKITQRLYFDSEDSTYFLRLTTSNRFDRALYFNLGDKQEAILSIKQMIDFIDTAEKGTALTIQDDKFNEEIYLSKYDKNNIFVTAKGYAGSTFLQKPSLSQWWVKITERK